MQPMPTSSRRNILIASRIRRFGAIVVLCLTPLSSHSAVAEDTGNTDGALPSFVRAEHGAKSCWMTQIPPAQLEAEPGRRAKFVALSMQTEVTPADTDWAGGRTLYNYELSIAFTDGQNSRALGNCLPYGTGKISCSVECDGGGAVVSHADNGAVDVDFAPFGGIRLNYCGEGGDPLRFEPAPEEARFTLQRRPDAECPSVDMPDWDAGID